MGDNFQDAQREGLVDSITGLRADYDESGLKWSKFNALCLDGGGSRGLWTLLVMQDLMRAIAKKEEADQNFHSFCPRPWPLELASDLTEDEKQKKRDAGDSDEAKLRALRHDRRYLPCHYFDYICGSSTGALIAIMLGRLRMTIADCILEYENMAQTIFGNPRFFIAMRFGMGSRCKYDHKVAEKVFQDVVRRRNEQPPGDRMGNVWFPMPRGSCATLVTTQKWEDEYSSTNYLIRSYDHEERTRVRDANTGGSSRVPTGFSTDTSRSKPKPPNRKGTNYEAAQGLEIWQVARAATAADFYFKPWTQRKKPTPVLLTDGGFGLYNNPTELARQEIEQLHGKGSTDVVVSVGTARRTRPERAKGFFTVVPKSMRKWANELTDPEPAHSRMEEKHNESQGSAQSFEYHRLNHPGGLQIELDEWQPRKSTNKTASGSETVTAIRNDVNAYLNEEGVRKEIKKCAAKLVKRRQERSRTREWERFATVAKYKCCWRGCPSLEDFSNDKDFEGHLREKHSESDPGLLKEQVDECRRRWQYQETSGGGS